MYSLLSLLSIIFFMWSPLVKRHLSDHLLWSIFQSSLHILHITNHVGPSVWAAIINESASRIIWITTEIFLAPSRIRTHWDRESSVISALLYLQATMAGFFISFIHSMQCIHCLLQLCFEIFSWHYPRVIQMLVTEVKSTRLDLKFCSSCISPIHTHTHTHTHIQT